MDLPDNAIVFIENRPWGYLLDVDSELQRTAFPNLGILEVRENIQYQTYNAILNDDITWLKNLGITHTQYQVQEGSRVSSASSDHWSIISEHEGSRIWQFQEIPEESTREIMILGIDEVFCQLGCDWRAFHGLDYRMVKFSCA